MPHEYWEEEFLRGMLRSHRSTPDNSHENDPLAIPEQIMSEGQRIDHLELNCVEPKVNAQVRIVDEDDLLVIVEKSAGLPSHASGRFNRNTLEHLINQAYRPEKIRLVHRLDANTSGIMVLARRFTAAKHLQQQFTDGLVTKRYLAKVHGHPAVDRLQCDSPIARECDAGGVRLIDPVEGLAARTKIEVLQRNSDGTTLLSVWPESGRTNQIRCHLWHLGFPIVNDPAYLIDGQIAANRTLAPEQPPMCLHALELQFTHPLYGTVCKWVANEPAWVRR
jgi:RluA family pseudouridine synthase